MMNETGTPPGLWLLAGMQWMQWSPASLGLCAAPHMHKLQVHLITDPGLAPKTALVWDW